MHFTAIFIRRPVLAVVVSLFILVLGLRSVFTLQVLQYPHTENAVVTITTSYFGADPETVAGFVTTPLENAIAQANGIDYMTSISQTGISTITANLRLNYDSGRALTEINTKVNSVKNQLPAAAQQPVISVKVGQTLDSLYLGFTSTVLAANQITDYLTRVVQPRLQSVAGVQTAEILGAKTFALRIWLDPIKLAAYGMTATDVSTALASNDYLSGLGTTKGQMVQFNLAANTSLHSLDEYRDLVVKKAGGTNIKLSDLGTVTLGANDYDARVAFNGESGVFVGIQVAPSANLLDVIKRVRDVFPDVQAHLPVGLNGTIMYDSTDFVNASIHEVIVTLFEALGIVTVVIFVFVGSWRSVVIPLIAIPLSLVGSFTMMLIFGFSINLLTLLALVLAIGLVVDDAIIVVENVHRHISEGKSPLDSAFIAAKELGNPIIAMTIVLIAVYIPIGFQGGLTGALFIEFAFTLAGAVTVSAIVALTLTPMCCGYFLQPHATHGDMSLEDRIVWAIDKAMNGVRDAYLYMLRGSLKTASVTIVFAVIVLLSIAWLYINARSELAPDEDQSFVLAMPTFAADATTQQKMLYARQGFEILHARPETETVFQVVTPSFSIYGWKLKSVAERHLSSAALQNQIQGELGTIAGSRVVAFLPASLPGSSGLPVQFVIQSTDSYDNMARVSNAILTEAQATHRFLFLDSDLKIDQPQATIVVDRGKAAQLGLSMGSIGGALSSMLSGGYVQYFDLDGRSYQIIPQVGQRFRLNPAQLLDYKVRTVDGTLISLSTVATVKTSVAPEALNHFQQANAVTISGVATPGVVTSDALATLREIAERNMPAGYAIDYAGASRQYVQESSGILATYGFALIIIFLALSAQFNSFRDPLIILVSVPMSIAGALVFIMIGIGGSSINIYTQVGLLTLMGLISKHGILLVEVANEQQMSGRSKLEAIVTAASIRLRPILMTTSAMVLGVMPLLIARGAGAASRFNMGLVIASGLAIGTLFTLFVLPAVYMVIAKAHHEHRLDEEIAEMSEPAPVH